MSKWKYIGWLYPGEATWHDACWFIGGTAVGSTWWEWSDKQQCVVESFCFEKKKGTT